jgi:hypothetical protein
LIDLDILCSFFPFVVIIQQVLWVYSQLFIAPQKLIFLKKEYKVLLD